MFFDAVPHREKGRYFGRVGDQLFLLEARISKLETILGAEEDIRLSTSGLHYLVEGDRCFFGYVRDIEDDRMYEVTPVSEGELYSCARYVVPQDPSFDAFPVGSEYVAWHDRGIKKPLRITEHALDRFEERASHLFDHSYRRDWLRDLMRFLDVASPVWRRNVERQYEKHGPSSYLTTDGWIFVLEKPDVLKTCYHKGNIREHGYYFIEEH